jgi:hypothetical protein
MAPGWSRMPGAILRTYHNPVNYCVVAGQATLDKVAIATGALLIKAETERISNSFLGPPPEVFATREMP